MTRTETKRRHAACQKNYIRNLPPEIHVWKGMKRRCNEPGRESYRFYGALGIRVCQRWLERGTGFKNFLADMGQRPSPSHELDRIDSSKDYSLENCRWLPKFENRSRANGRNQFIGDQDLPGSINGTPGCPEDRNSEAALVSVPGQLAG